MPTNGIVHAGFRGFRRFVARKKGWCKLIGFRFVIPHDTIPSTVRRQARKKHSSILIGILLLTLHSKD